MWCPGICLRKMYGEMSRLRRTPCAVKCICCVTRSRHINQFLARAGVELERNFSVPHFAAVPYIVNTTDLLATVSEKLAFSASVHFRLGLLKPPLTVPALQTNLYWHRRFYQDDGNQWMRSLIVRAFADTA